MLADFEIKVDQVNPEEAQFGSTGEYIQDGEVAIRIRKIGGTLLLDNTLSPEERANVSEMALLKTNNFKNVNLRSRILRLIELETASIWF